MLGKNRPVPIEPLIKIPLEVDRTKQGEKGLLVGLILCCACFWLQYLRMWCLMSTLEKSITRRNLLQVLIMLGMYYLKQIEVSNSVIQIDLSSSGSC